MTKKGGRDFNLSQVGGGGARGEGVRRTARTFFEVEQTSPGAVDERGPEDSSGGEVSAGGGESPRRAGAVGSSGGRRAPRRADSSRRAGASRNGEGDPRASWRAPREDGRLRTNDHAVLDFLRTRLADEGDTTEEVAMREIADSCGVSVRTVQNIVIRLQDARLLTRIEPPLGSNKGCQYRISKNAPKPRFAAAGK